MKFKIKCESRCGDNCGPTRTLIIGAPDSDSALGKARVKFTNIVRDEGWSDKFLRCIHYEIISN